MSVSDATEARLVVRAGFRHGRFGLALLTLAGAAGVLLAAAAWLEADLALRGLVIAGAALGLAAIAAVAIMVGRQARRLQAAGHALAARDTELQEALRVARLQQAELLASQHTLGEKSNALQTTLDHINQGLIMVDAQRRVAVYNQRAVEMLGLPVQLMESRPSYEEMMLAQSAARGFSCIEEAFPEYRRTALVFDVAHTYERQRHDGRILEIQSVPLQGGGMVRTFTDITNRRRAEAQVKYLAEYDAITRLHNRHVFQERLERAVAAADAGGPTLAVLYIDLDHFKQVNDTSGHATGDRLLAEAAERMRAIVRAEDTIARMGGDEFAVIQSLANRPEPGGQSAAQQAANLAERLLQAIRAPYDIDGATSRIGASIGIAVYQKDGCTTAELLRRADTALYRVKGDGRGFYRFFSAGMDDRQQQRFELEQALRAAVAAGDFSLEYQPIVDSGTRQALAYEALLRWRTGAGAAVSPPEFMAVAEASGLIVQIGAWAIEQACTEAASWPDDLQVSVNLSPVQFRHGGLFELIGDVLRRTGLAPERLSLEVTEGLLLEGTQEVLATMSRLKALGIRFSLDDFGTAQAGLSYLRCFPFDSLKIDQSFVQDAVERVEARAIVEAIMAMGRALGLTVIAEGVETEEQLKLLRQMQCQQVQGYLTGVPLPADALFGGRLNETLSTKPQHRREAWPIG